MAILVNMILSILKKEVQDFFSNFNYVLIKKDGKNNQLLIRLGLSFFTLFLILFLIGIHITPPHYALPFYIKRVQEKMIMKIIPTNDMKADYYLHLQEKRLNDIRFVVDHKRYECLLACAQRYSGNAGELSEFLKSTRLINKNDVTIQTFKKHRQQLEEIVARIPKDQNLDWKYVVDSINYLDAYVVDLSSIK